MMVEVNLAHLGLIGGRIELIAVGRQYCMQIFAVSGYL